MGKAGWIRTSGARTGPAVVQFFRFRVSTAIRQGGRFHSPIKLLVPSGSELSPSE